MSEWWTAAFTGRWLIKRQNQEVSLCLFFWLLLIILFLGSITLENDIFPIITVNLLLRNFCTALFSDIYWFKFNWGKAYIFPRRWMHKCLLLIDDLCTSSRLSVTRCLCLLPGSWYFTSGVVHLRGESQLTVETQANRWNIGTKETLNGESASLWAHLPAEQQTVVGHVTQPRLPAFCRMSVSAPKGLASSGQKPITEITHPLSAAEEPLSISVTAGGEKVQSAAAWRHHQSKVKDVRLTVGSNPRTSSRTGFSVRKNIKTKQNQKKNKPEILYFG